MKFLTKSTLAIVALGVSVTNVMANPDARMEALQLMGATCMQSGAAQQQSVCEKSLADVIEIQPKLEYLNQQMMSYMVEIHARTTLAEIYLKNKNLAGHCEQAEKAWLSFSYASQYSEHPFYAGIQPLTTKTPSNVKTCRSIAGKPEWGAAL